MKNKISQYLGIARKARLVKQGMEITLDQIRSKKAKLVLVSSSASDNTKKKINDKSLYYEIKILEIDEIVLNTVYKNKPPKVLCILDEGISKKILDLNGSDDNEKATNKINEQNTKKTR